MRKWEIPYYLCYKLNVLLLLDNDKKMKGCSKKERYERNKKIILFLHHQKKIVPADLIDKLGLNKHMVQKSLIWLENLGIAKKIRMRHQLRNGVWRVKDVWISTASLDQFIDAEGWENY